ncbi:unnamed protein product [Zymoseptoria tritici ST99CH_3D7]|uniref:Uncharacterized protein n=1 Tax=Zymoseptoria tritici (strain ST99CH_3D7) TaxID=1276538 RepID=A0A1X7S7E8_ZYMT9|nr:unnamed protein product [Zymoseptoria tritici ST99CH_3D7]
MGNASSKQKVALREQLEALDKQCKITTELKAAIEAELAGTSKTLEDRDKDLQNLRDEIKELTQANATVRQDKLNAISNLQNELSRELQGQLRVAESLTQERNRARKQAAELEAELKEKDESSRLAVTEAKTLREKLEESVSSHEAELQKMKDELAALQESNKTQVEELERKAQDEMAAVQQKHTTTTAEEKSKTQKDIAELVQSSKLLRTRNVELEEELATTKTALETSEKERTSLTDRVISLAKANSESEQALASYQSGSRTALDDLSNTQAALTTAQTERAALEQKLSTLESQLASEKSARAALQTSSSTVHNDLAAAVKRADGLAAENAATQRALADAQAAKDALQQKFNAGISKQSGLFEAFQALKIELAETQGRYREVVNAQGGNGGIAGDQRTPAGRV